MQAFALDQISPVLLALHLSPHRSSSVVESLYAGFKEQCVALRTAPHV